MGRLFHALGGQASQQVPLAGLLPALPQGGLSGAQ
jgi:hypothetical protein